MPKEDAILREGVRLQSTSTATLFSESFAMSADGFHCYPAQEGRTINWNEIAKEIPGRSNKDCRKRYYNEVTGGLKKVDGSPEIRARPIKVDASSQGPWTAAEDSKLKSCVVQDGLSWALIAQKMGNRSADRRRLPVPFG